MEKLYYGSYSAKTNMNWFATVLRVVICFIILMDLTELSVEFCVDEVIKDRGDFDVGETQVFQNCNDKIVATTPRSSTPRDTATTPKCQEAPRTMFSSQNHWNDSKIPA